MSEITALLAAARDGDSQAAGRVFSLLYEDLRRVARSRLRQHQQFTLLDTTGLVHESYLKLVRVASLPVEDKRHFIVYASSVMRSVVVDFARARSAERRGGDADHLVLDTALSEQISAPEDEVVRVHESLQVLSQVDAVLAQIVEMRYFAGLTEQEIADALGVSERTVRRQWEKAKLLLSTTLR